MIGCLLAVAIQLSGVTGTDLRARAFFDANNVKVGDPLVLTVDFLGSAEFRDLHPPALARAVGRKDWKIDDASAKTDTYRDARRLTYRVRPLREGVLWFPSLEFAYSAPDGSERLIRSNEIPVHARAGVQVVIAEMDESRTPDPAAPVFLDSPDWHAPGLSASLSDDVLFAWRKALAKPTAEAFAAFDFPAAKMNEATCAIRDGNWAHALGVYSRLEWRIGQVPEIERGIRAALALREDSPDAELPVWRTVGRPLLRFAWLGRVSLVLGSFLVLALVFWLLGRGIRAVAALAVVVLPVLPLAGETIETVTTNADGSVVRQIVSHGNNGSFSFSFSSSSSGTKGGRGLEPFALMEEFERFDPFGRRPPRQRRAPVAIGVALAADKDTVLPGEPFNLTLTLDMPRHIALSDGVRLTLDEQSNLTQLGPGQPLPSERSANPTNVLQRFVFPMRANVPFTNFHYVVESSYAYSGESFFLRETYPFSSGRRLSTFRVDPLPDVGRPDDFSGLVATCPRLYEYCDLLRVGTNDVVTITYKLTPNGFVPPAYQPAEVAYEWSRQTDAAGQPSEIVYRRYFVADGAPATPRLKISYYDPVQKGYRTVQAGGTALTYTP